MAARQGIENVLVDAVHARRIGPDSTPAGRGQPHGIGAGIVTAPPPMQVALIDEARHHVGHGRSVDAGDVHQCRLAGALVALDRPQYGELPGGQTAASDVTGI